MKTAYQERLWGLVHKAIGDCCVRDLNSWLVTPQEAEQRILKDLDPLGDMLEPEEAREQKTETQQEILKKLAKASGEFRVLMDTLKKLPEEVKLSDVELDVVRCKAKLEMIDWFASLVPLTFLEIEKRAEIERQLQALEQVVA